MSRASGRTVTPPSSTIARLLALAAGVFVVISMLLSSGSAAASIDRIYTLPFYSSWIKTCGVGCYSGHRGTDYQLGDAANPGEVVAAAFKGSVQRVNSQTSAGKYIVIDHGNTHMTRYLHLQDFVGGSGSVARGEVIAYEGNTGGPWCQDPPQCTIWASPYHLHFETKINATPGDYTSGTAVDPYDSNTYLWEDNAPGDAAHAPNHADFSPAIASFCCGRVDIFVRGKGNGLWQRTRYGNGAWSGWSQPRPGDCLKSAPAASTWSTTRIDVFYRGCDNVIYWTKWTGSAWAASAPLGASCTLGAPAAASWGTNRIDVFYRGCNNLLYWTYTTNGGSSWSTHTTVPYATCLRSGPGAVSWSSGRLDVVYRGCDDAIYHHWYTGAWQPPESFGGCTMLAPSIASWGSTKLDVFHRGCGPWYWEGVFHKSYNGSSWSAWTDRGGCLASAPRTDAWAPDWLNVLYRGCDSPANVYNLYWNGGSWAHAFSSYWP